jgi:hypothetical protein
MHCSDRPDEEPGLPKREREIDKGHTHTHTGIEQDIAKKGQTRQQGSRRSTTDIYHSPKGPHVKKPHENNTKKPRQTQPHTHHGSHTSLHRTEHDTRGGTGRGT